jgi:DNA-binding CsgD family transcriptional regulator
VEWFVEWGLTHRQLRGVESIGVDEIHWGRAKRADNFLTVIYQIDAHCRRLLRMGRRRSQATLRRGLKALGPGVVQGPFSRSAFLRNRLVFCIIYSYSGVSSERSPEKTTMGLAAYSSHNPFRRLNKRQEDTLRLICIGLRNSEIALQLGVSVRSVKSYVSQLFLIFEVTNRTELASVALIEGGSPSYDSSAVDRALRRRS